MDMSKIDFEVEDPPIELKRADALFAGMVEGFAQLSDECRERGLGIGDLRLIAAHWLRDKALQLTHEEVAGMLGMEIAIHCVKQLTKHAEKNKIELLQQVLSRSLKEAGLASAKSEVKFLGTTDDED